MSLKKARQREKARIALEREQKAAERQSRIAKKFKPPAFTPLKPKQSRHVETDAMKKARLIPSHSAKNVVVQSAVADHLISLDMAALEARMNAFAGTPEGEMYLREFEARQEFLKLLQQTAPLYPKGPYQLITDPNAPKYFNRKDGGI